MVRAGLQRMLCTRDFADRQASPLPSPFLSPILGAECPYPNHEYVFSSSTRGHLQWIDIKKKGAALSSIMQKGTVSFFFLCADPYVSVT